MNNTENNLLIDWILFLSNPLSEDVKMIQERVPAIKEAMGVLQVMSHDRETRALYEARLKVLRDKNSQLHFERENGVEEGREKGALEKAQEIATKMM